MPKIRLTVDSIDKAECLKEGQDFFWDTETQGFALRVTKNGDKSYIYQGMTKKGKTIRKTIGNIKSWYLEEARIEAKKYQVMIDKGEEIQNEESKTQEEIYFSDESDAYNYAMQKADEAYNAALDFALKRIVCNAP